MASQDQIVLRSALEKAITNMGSKIDDMKPESITHTLSSGNWVGSSAPYTYELSVEGVTETNVVIVSIANSLSLDDFATQYDQNIDADIRRVIQSTDKLTFVAYGTKPTVDLNFDISVL